MGASQLEVVAVSALLSMVWTGTNSLGRALGGTRCEPTRVNSGVSMVAAAIHQLLQASVACVMLLYRDLWQLSAINPR